MVTRETIISAVLVARQKTGAALQVIREVGRSLRYNDKLFSDIGLSQSTMEAVESGTAPIEAVLKYAEALGFKDLLEVIPAANEILTSYGVPKINALNIQNQNSIIELENNFKLLLGEAVSKIITTKNTTANKLVEENPGYISMAKLYQYKKGESMPSNDMLIKLVRCLGCKDSDITTNSALTWLQNESGITFPPNSADLIDARRGSKDTKRN